MKKDRVKFEVGQLWRTRISTLVEIIDVNVPCNYNMYTVKVKEVESGEVYTVDVNGYFEAYYDNDCMDEDLKHYVGMNKVEQITYKTVTLIDKIIMEEIEVMQDTPYISKFREENIPYIVSQLQPELMQVELEVEHIDIKTFVMNDVEYTIAFSKEVKESLLYKMLDSVMTERDNLLIRNSVIKRDNDILRFNLEAGNASKSNWFINLFKRIKNVKV